MLALALAPLPPPSLLPRLLAARRRHGAPPDGSGRLRSFLLVAWEGQAGAWEGCMGRPHRKAAWEGQVGGSAGGGAEAPPAASMALCECSAAGAPLRVAALCALPPSLAGVAGGTQPPPPPQSQQGKRKRRDSTEPGEPVPDTRQAQQADPDLGFDPALAVRWCGALAARTQLLAQLTLLHMPCREELRWGGGGGAVRAVVLPPLPALHVLGSWARGAADSTSAGSQGLTAGSETALAPEDSQGIAPAQPEAVLLQADPARPGRWTLEVRSNALAELPTLHGAAWVGNSRRGVEHLQVTPSGLHGQYDLQAGDDAACAVCDVLRVARLQLCEARLRALVRSCGVDEAALRHSDSTPFFQPSAPAGGPGLDGGSASATWLLRTPLAPRTRWSVPGSATVGLMEVGTTHVALLVRAADPAAQAGQAVAVTVEWVPAVAERAAAAQPAESSADGGAAAAWPGADGLVRCRVACEPALPGGAANALAALLEAGREEAFLDALCVSCPSEAALQQCLLSDEALRSAGLPPAAAEPLPGTRGAFGGGARLAAGRRRPADVHWRCVAGGMVLLSAQLAPAETLLGEGDWLGRAWGAILSLPGCSAVPTSSLPNSGAHQAQHLAWVPTGALPEACQALLGGLECTAAQPAAALAPTSL